MKRLLSILGFVTLVLALAAPSFAFTVSVNFDPGVTQRISGLADPADGATMAGMVVTALGTSGIGSPVTTDNIWNATGPGSGLVILGQGFSSGVSESGDTSANNWSLGYLGNLSHIDKITIDALAGNTVFDTSFGGKKGTKGSGKGQTFEVINYDASAGLSDIVVTYRDQVAVGGKAPKGDLYRYVDIAFPSSVGFRAATLEFAADTDRITVVPLPASLLFLGSGLGLLAFLPRKKYF